MSGQATDSSRSQLPPTRARHAVLGLIVVVYVITYMDRVSISSAMPVLQRELGISIVTVGWIFSSFRWGYALFQIPGGWFGDKIGPRRALALVVCWWSLFTSLTALAWSATSIGFCRFLFGIGEAGAFPIATRSLSRWLPAEERGIASGLPHAASRLGAALTPALVVALMIKFGWRIPFFLFGFMGLAWAAAWYLYYRDKPAEHASVNAAELELIQRSSCSPDGSNQTVPWRLILTNRTVWMLSLMYFCYGYSIDIYLDWFPKYLYDARGLDLKRMGFYASLPFIAGAAGDVLGGMVSDRWAARTKNLKTARRSVAGLGFLIATFSMLAATFEAHTTAAVIYSCLAVFGLELTVGVSWAIPLDIGGNYAGSIASIMNTFGNLGSALSPALLGYLVRQYSWNVPFVLSSFLCLIAIWFCFRIDPTCEVAIDRPADPLLAAQ
jgi:MFS transporter, ACS family, glucarate transporter